MILNEKRYGLVSGSRCSALVPKKTAEKGMESLAMELAMEKVFEFRDEINTWQMEHGRYAEPFAFDFFKNKINSTLEKGSFYLNGEICGTTDAECDDYGVEFKCPTTMLGWLENLFIDENSVDKKYYYQCQMYMMLTGKDKWLLCYFLEETLRMNDNGITYPIEKDKRMIIVIINKNDDWQLKFNKNLPILIEKRDFFINEIKKKLRDKAFKFGT